MITASNLCLEFGQLELFKDLSFSIEKNQKIGLVGRNGSGKSTLLKVLSGLQGIDSGKLLIEKNVKIAYFPQEVVLISNRSVIEETLTAFGGLVDFKLEFDKLHTEFEKESIHCPEKIERFAFLQKELSDNDFDQCLIETKKMLSMLDFPEENFNKPVGELSVGWKMRIVLAKLLLQKADFYLFDEPTNHLDIVAKDWFLDFLKHANFGFVLISHDRYFLDYLCQYIFDIDRGNLKIYRGNYTTYLEQKTNDDAVLVSQYEAQQRHIKKTMETINRFKAKASKASMAQSMLKNLEKIELIKIESNPPTIKLNFSNVKRSGDIVLKVSNVNKIFESVELFKNISFDIMRGDKVALIAANGKGKTTLLNLIAGKYPLENGTLKFGHNVEMAFFEQDQELTLNKNRTILEEVESICTTSEMRSRVRGLLGAFLFSGNDVEKKISVLSGGEKNRVAMVKTLLLDANFLILDEPTNHLDIQTKDILLKALNQYPGTILFVSHDRTFVDGLASRILELNPNGIHNYPGNYESFLYHKKHTELEKSTNSPSDKSNKKTTHIPIQSQTTLNKTVSSKEWYEAKKQVGSIERKIEALEKQLIKLNQDFEFLEFGTQDFDKTSKRIVEVKAQIEKMYEEWECLQKKINH